METQNDLRIILCRAEEKCGIVRYVSKFDIQKIIISHFSKVHYLTSSPDSSGDSAVEIGLIGEKAPLFPSNLPMNRGIKYWCGDTFYGDVLMIALTKVSFEVFLGREYSPFSRPSFSSSHYDPVSIRDEDVYYYLNQFHIVNKFFLQCLSFIFEEKLE